MTIPEPVRVRAVAAFRALVHLVLQTALWLDQGLNAVVLGLAAVGTALVTGKPQDVAYADETLSAHAYRARVRGRIWATIFEKPVDLLFFWQRTDQDVLDGDNKPIAEHCRRAFWKKRRHKGLPADYSNPDFPPAVKD